MYIDHVFKACEAVPADFGGGSAFDKVWVMAKLAATLELKTYVEIGVYRGRSFLPLARAFGLLGGFSYGIDPYDRDEAMEHDVAPELAEAVTSFIDTTDYAAVYQGFLRSQAQLGLTSVSLLIRETSHAAVSFFRDCRISPDMVHVDGNHDTKHAMKDVEDYIPLLSGRGILVIDDVNWESVKPALAFAREHLDVVFETETYAVLCRKSTSLPAPPVLTEICRRAEAEALRHMRRERAGTPKVSVSLITFNQENYIAQAIRSVLDQDVDFRYELVIGDDASTDGTAAICADFQQRHPDRIRLIRRKANIGPVRNYLATYQACSGTYVAFLEGDDFWTDRLKLRRQVAFLDANPDHAISCHNVYVADASGRLGAKLLNDVPASTTVRHLCRGDYIATASCMIRNGQTGTIPPWIYGLPGCDWPFDILNAMHGKIGYFQEPMAAYRVHPASIWSSLDPLKKSLMALRIAAAVNRNLSFQFRFDFDLFVDQVLRVMDGQLSGSRDKPSAGPG